MAVVIGRDWQLVIRWQAFPPKFRLGFPAKTFGNSFPAKTVPMSFPAKTFFVPRAFPPKTNTSCLLHSSLLLASCLLVQMQPLADADCRNPIGAAWALVVSVHLCCEWCQQWQWQWQWQWSADAFELLDVSSSISIGNTRAQDVFYLR